MRSGSNTSKPPIQIRTLNLWPDPQLLLLFSDSQLVSRFFIILQHFDQGVGSRSFQNGGLDPFQLALVLLLTRTDHLQVGIILRLLFLPGHKTIDHLIHEIMLWTFAQAVLQESYKLDPPSQEEIQHDPSLEQYAAEETK